MNWVYGFVDQGRHAGLQSTVDQGRGVSGDLIRAIQVGFDGERQLQVSLVTGIGVPRAAHRSSSIWRSGGWISTEIGATRRGEDEDAYEGVTHVERRSEAAHGDEVVVAMFDGVARAWLGRRVQAVLYAGSSWCRASSSKLSSTSKQRSSNTLD